MKVVVAVVGLFLASAASPVLAANADQPYQNVEKKNDAGNDTGNSRVDTLNRGQLDQNQGVVAPALGAAPSPASSPAQAPAPASPPR